MQVAISVVAIPVLAVLVGAVGCHETTGTSNSEMSPIWISPVANVGQEWVNGTPAAADGRVYIQESNALVGIQAATGARLWTRRIRVAAAPPPTTLLADAGVLYVSETDSVMAVDGATGNTIWSVHPDSQAVVVPALDATGLYTGQRGLAVVYALERANGSVRWKVNTVVGSAYAAHVRGLAVSGDTVYATVEKWLDLNGVASKGVLVALDRLTGAELWRYETPGSRDYFFSQPIVAGNQIILTDAYAGVLIAVDSKSHAERWRVDVGGANRAFVIGSTVLAAGATTKARGIDLETGVVKWVAETGSSPLGAGVCGNSFFVSAIDLRRFDMGTGALTGVANRASSGGFFSYVAGDGTRAYAIGGNGAYSFGC